jgi:hypothetical protein
MRRQAFCLRAGCSAFACLRIIAATDDPLFERDSPGSPFAFLATGPCVSAFCGGCLVTAKTSLAFHSWTVDTGPLVESNTEIWDEIAGSLATFRRKISDFWIVADEVREAARPAGAAGRGYLRA